MPAKKHHRERDPLLTAKGERYTYAGYVRKRNAIKSLGARLEFDKAYGEYFNKMIKAQDSKRQGLEKSEAKRKEKTRDNPYKEKLSRMTLDELRHEYYELLKESMTGFFNRENAAHHQTLVARELRKRGIRSFKSELGGKGIPIKNGRALETHGKY